MLSIILKTIEDIIETEKKVTVNQQKIIDEIKKNPYITQGELADIVGITRKSIVANMKKLQEIGLIKRIGADKNGFWQIENSILYT